MAYEEDKQNRVSFILRFKCKVGKHLAKVFPLNRVRKFGLKLCGFKIGSKVYIGPDLLVASILGDKRCNLDIQDRVAIGPRVTLILSSDANWSKLMLKFNSIRGSIVLEKDCWIGAGAIILPDIIIGEGAIVGAGAIVTKNVDPFTVVAGNPAKKIKDIERFLNE